MLRALPRTLLPTLLLLRTVRTVSRRPSVLHSGNTIALDHVSATFIEIQESMCVQYLHVWIHTAEFALVTLLASFAGDVLRVVTAAVEEVLEGSSGCHFVIGILCCLLLFPEFAVLVEIQGLPAFCMPVSGVGLRICGEMNEW